MKTKIEEGGGKKQKGTQKKSDSKHCLAGLEDPAALVWSCCGVAVIMTVVLL